MMGVRIGGGFVWCRLMKGRIIYNSCDDTITSPFGAMCARICRAHHCYSGRVCTWWDNVAVRMRWVALLSLRW